MAVQVGKAAIFNGCSDSQALRARSRGRSCPAFFEAVEAEQNAALLAQQLNQKKTQCDEGQELQYQAADHNGFEHGLNPLGVGIATTQALSISTPTDRCNRVTERIRRLHRRTS